jgi:hypothetical protein
VTDLLEGVDESTPRNVLLARLRDAAGLLFQRQDAKVARLQEIEERVRRDFAGTQANLIQVLATASDQEWREAVDFLANFEGLLPVALLRLYDGVKTATEGLPRNQTKAPPD